MSKTRTPGWPTLFCVRERHNGLVAAGLALAFVVVGLFGAACDDPTELGTPPILGTEDRVRYVVSLDGPAPDLAEYRTLLKENPGGVAGYVDKKRGEAAAALGAVDAAVSSLNGRVVERWWMSNQATIEIPATGVATVRSVPGVKSVEPDRPLQ